jgi:hypoxanthine phosphoribosyltransferase
MSEAFGHVLIDEERIASRVRELGATITSDLRRELAAEGNVGEDRIVLVPILMGAVVFVADLIRCIPLRMRMDAVAVSSYPGATIASKGPAIRSALPRNLNGRHVLVVDDILDTGQTLGIVRKLILEQQPASLRICVLLRKACPRVIDVPIDYAGFDIPDEFVVGYGLDYDGYHRNVPAIGVLREGRA